MITAYFNNRTEITFTEYLHTTAPSGSIPIPISDLSRGTNIYTYLNNNFDLYAKIEAVPYGTTVDLDRIECIATNGNKLVFSFRVVRGSGGGVNLDLSFYFHIDGDTYYYIVPTNRICSMTLADWNAHKYTDIYLGIMSDPFNNTATTESIKDVYMLYNSSSDYNSIWSSKGTDPRYLTTYDYLKEWFMDMPIPAQWGDDSETGGGEGNFDISTDTIDFPNLPTGSALETGLINMYKCDASDLRGLGEFLWSTDFATNILKVFNDPMEAFVSLNLFPVTPATADEKQTIKFGNLNAVTLIGEGGQTVYHKAYPLTSQYVEFDCGTVNINEFFGSALDYNPYTQVQIYLPFIGFQNLSVDDIMDGSITLKYHIDMLTGTCTALIKCEKSSKYNLDSVLYSFAGSMNMAVPISAGNYSNALMTLTTGLAGIGIGVATGGTGTAVASAAAGSAMNMLNAKAQVQRSGGIVMNAGALGNLTPYIIITRPVQHKPEDYQKFKGWENNITYTLSALQGKGYTEIMYTHIEGLTATDEEKAEIETLLKDGVIL